MYVLYMQVYTVYISTVYYVHFKPAALNQFANVLPNGPVHPANEVEYATNVAPILGSTSRPLIPSY